MKTLIEGDLRREQVEDTVRASVIMTEEARNRIANFITLTPIVEIQTPHDNVQILVKDEACQVGGSFKSRGAANAVMTYVEQGAEHVVTASAGNHGRGVAHAARKLGIDSTIFVGKSVSQEKRVAIQRLGGKVVVVGDTYDDAAEESHCYAQKKDLTLVHAFDDPLVRAGQGTIGSELLDENNSMTHLVLPVGGGGLLSGVASVVKSRRPDVQIIAAQVEGCSAFAESLKTGKLVSKIDPRAAARFEGVAVGRPLPMNVAIGSLLVDRMFVVRQRSVYEAIHQWQQHTGILLETAGAVGLAGANQLALDLSREVGSATIVTAATGANPPAALKSYVNRRFGPSAFLP